MGLKESKIAQTDYTRGGRDISNTAIPYYKDNLTQLHNYLGNVQNRLDPYMKYVDMEQAAPQSDFMTEYLRSMGDMTAQNYAATSGGYSSANQRNYDDLQDYYNDYQSRLYSHGLGRAEQMANNEYNMLAQTPQIWHNAYNAGQAYSNVDQYNQMVDDYNKNAWTNIANTAGNVLSSIPNGYTKAIGAGLKTVGGLAGKDFSAMDGLRARATGVADTNQYNTGRDNSLVSLGGTLKDYLGGFDWAKPKKNNKGGQS